MMEQKIDPPNLGFWKFLEPTFKLFLQFLGNNSCVQEKTVLKGDKSTKTIPYLNQFFYMMKQKVYPPNLGFWTLVLAYFQIMYVIFQKNWLRARETSVERRQK